MSGRYGDEDPYLDYDYDTDTRRAWMIQRDERRERVEARKAKQRQRKQLAELAEFRRLIDLQKARPKPKSKPKSKPKPRQADAQPSARAPPAPPAPPARSQARRASVRKQQIKPAPTYDLQQQHEKPPAGPIWKFPIYNYLYSYMNPPEHQETQQQRRQRQRYQRQEQQARIRDARNRPGGPEPDYY